MATSQQFKVGQLTLVNAHKKSHYSEFQWLCIQILHLSQTFMNNPTIPIKFDICMPYNDNIREKNTVKTF